jgi:hypothetical protein
MFLQLASPYIPVVVLVLFWVVAMRPVLRLIHVSPSRARRTALLPAPAHRRPARR